MIGLREGRVQRNLGLRCAGDGYPVDQTGKLQMDEGCREEKQGPILERAFSSFLSVMTYRKHSPFSIIESQRTYVTTEEP